MFLLFAYSFVFAYLLYFAAGLYLNLEKKTIKRISKQHIS